MNLGALLAHQTHRRSQTYGPYSISEKPSGPFIAVGGAPVAAGVPVSETTAQGIPVVFSCDRVLKQDVAKTPIKLKRRNQDGTRTDDPNHPIYHALHDLANPAMTAYEFKETMQGYLNLWGNAYAEIVRKRDTVELWPLEPWRMTTDIDALSRLTYSYRMGIGKPREWIFDPANPPIFHLRQNASPWYRGRGPVQLLRESMGVAIARERYSARFYGQGGHPRVALSTTQRLTKESAQRIRSDFEQLTVGEANWHRAIVLDHDLKPVPLVMPMRDAQFVEDKQLTRDDLCGVFRVPPHKVMNLARSTNNNIEHQGIEWVTDGLMPHFVCWQQAIARDLLNPRSFNTHFAVFVVDALVRGDFKTLNEGLAIQRQNGVITANEWRRTVDMDDQIKEADGGDLYLVNGNMMPMLRDPAAVIAFTASGGAN